MDYWMDLYKLSDKALKVLDIKPASKNDGKCPVYTNLWVNQSCGHCYYWEFCYPEKEI